MCVEILTIGVTPVVNLIENFENVCRNFDHWCNSCCKFN